MSVLVRLNKAVFRDRITRSGGPVWINPFGVNSIEECSDGAATWVRMDDGTGYLVAETPRTVVFRVNKQLKIRDGEE